MTTTVAMMRMWGLWALLGLLGGVAGSGATHEASGEPFVIDADVGSSQRIRTTVVETSDGGLAVAYTVNLLGSNQHPALMKMTATDVPAGARVAVTNRKGHARQFSAARLKNGRLVVVWDDWVDRQLNYRFFSSEGVPEAVHAAAPPAGTANVYDVRVAALEGGGFVVAYTASRDLGMLPTDVMRTYVEQYTADGERVAGPDSKTWSGVSSYADVTGLADGGYLFSFITNSAVYGARYDAAGVAVGDDTFLLAPTRRHGYKVARLVDGSLVVVYEAVVGVAGQRRSADGLTALGSEFTVSDVHGSEQPVVAALANGGFVVGWGQTAATKVYACVYDASGTRRGDDLDVMTYDRMEDLGVPPSVVGLENGGFALVWMRPGRKAAVYGRRYSAVDTVDLCASIDCASGNECMNPGTCVPTTGACSDGTPKDDKEACGGDSMERHCVAGTCVDKCSGVVCPAPTGPCMSPGTCVPTTGACSDGTPKDDKEPCGGASMERHCVAGTCVDKCSGVVCLSPTGPCKVRGTCVPTTGVCLPETESTEPECVSSPSPAVVRRRVRLAVKEDPSSCLVVSGREVGTGPCTAAGAAWVMSSHELRFLRNDEHNCYLRAVDGGKLECFAPTFFNQAGLDSVWHLVPTADTKSTLLLNLQHMTVVRSAGDTAGHRVLAAGLAASSYGSHFVVVSE